MKKAALAAAGAGAALALAAIGAYCLDGWSLPKPVEPFFEGLGDYTRPVTTSAPVAQRYFDQGLAFFYGFNFDESVRSFEAAAAADPRCAMAYWGIAMTYWHPIWPSPGPADLKAGTAAVEKAKLAGAKTQRELDYIAAIDTFYRD